MITDNRMDNFLKESTQHQKAKVSYKAFKIACFITKWVFPKIKIQLSC